MVWSPSGAHSGQTSRACAVPPKTTLYKVLNKTVTENKVYAPLMRWKFGLTTCEAINSRLSQRTFPAKFEVLNVREITLCNVE